MLRPDIPGCPVSLRDRIWIESRIGWLVERLGRDRMAAVPKALPVAEDFPEIYDRSPNWAQKIFERVSQLMGVDSAQIDLEAFQRKHAPYALGLYYSAAEGTRPVIAFEESQLDQPAELIAILAHELSHEVLLGGKLLSGNETDDEELTDLTAIFLGLGVFIANSSLNQSSVQWNWTTTTYLSTAGYLNATQNGYALAVLAWLGRADDTTWLRWLRPDQAAAVKAGLAYLADCDDPILDRDHQTRPIRTPSSFEELSAWLQGPSDARKMQALLQLGDVKYELPRAAQLLEVQLTSDVASIRSVSLEWLAELDGPWTETVQNVLARLASTDDVEQQRTVMKSLARRPPSADMRLASRYTWLEHLELVLRDPGRKLAVEAAEALAALPQPHSDRALAMLQDVFIEAVMKCELPADRLWRALEQADSDAEQNLLERLERRAPALIECVEEFWREIDAAEHPPDFDVEDDEEKEWEKYFE